MKKIIALILSLSIIASCSVKIANFEKYQKAPLLELEEMPTKEDLLVKLPRVIIITEKSETDDSEQINAQKQIRNTILTELQTKKYANIIERFDSSTIQSEIKIAEIEGKSSHSLSSVDYIINIGAPNVTFSAKTEEDIFFVASGSGIPMNRPMIYKYSSIVDGIVKLYEVPSLKIAKIIALNGSYHENEKASSTGSTTIGNISINTGQAIQSKTKDTNITYKAIQNGTKKAILEMKQFFKKKGFISEKRQLKDEVIFSINRGKEDDFLPQKKVIIVREVKIHNDLTDEDEKSEETICSGTIADKAFEKTSWVIFDKKCQEKIRLGDKTIIVYK